MYSLLYVLHLGGMVLWIGGLLYLTFLLNYHFKEITRNGNRAAHEVFSKLESRLFFGAATPGLLAAVICGLWMAISVRPDLWRQGLFHGKVTMALGLVALHVFTFLKMKDFHKNPPAEYSPFFMKIHGGAGVLLLLILFFVSRLP